MVTFEEAREHTIVHCYDCDRCCKDYDHHCPVLGNCIGKKNIWTFYGVIAFFIIATMIAYFSMYLMLTANMGPGSVNTPRSPKKIKIHNINDVLNTITNVVGG